MVTQGNVAITVTDGTDAISSASLTLTDGEDYTETDSTGNDGKATFEDVPNGEYTLTVEKSGYATETKSITVNGADVTVSVVLTATRSVSFTVNDGTDAIQGATVTIDGDTAGAKTTGSSGGCTATLTDGEHSLVVAKEGYTSKTETVTVDSTHTSFTISLTTSSP